MQPAKQTCEKQKQFFRCFLNIFSPIFPMLYVFLCHLHTWLASMYGIRSVSFSRAQAHLYTLYFNLTFFPYLFNSLRFFVFLAKRNVFRR